MKSKDIALISLVVLSLGFFFFVLIDKYPKNVLLLGGLDNRSGDLDINEQKNLLLKGLKDKNVKAFRYNDLSGLSEEIKNSKKPVYVVLFSAGGKKALEVAELFRFKGFDLKNIFIVQPYGKSNTTSNSIREAVKLGVPKKNILVGSSASTGVGIVNNPTTTPKCSPSHWCSLTQVGEFIK
tara:strand:- start:2430 stop:2972 length:543 start_codon:yes stop_codon:yes gene_type:complete